LKKFRLSNPAAFTFSPNYLRTPFGEMWAQNIWLTTGYSQLHGIFVRQYKNYAQTGLGIGYKLYHQPLFRNTYSDADGKQSNTIGGLW
jgi:hypothetical protein